MVMWSTLISVLKEGPNNKCFLTISVSMQQKPLPPGQIKRSISSEKLNLLWPPMKKDYFLIFFIWSWLIFFCFFFFFLNLNITFRNWQFDTDYSSNSGPNFPLFLVQFNSWFSEDNNLPNSLAVLKSLSDFNAQYSQFVNWHAATSTRY